MAMTAPDWITHDELESLVKIANLRLPPCLPASARVRLSWWEDDTCILMHGDYEMTPRLNKLAMLNRLQGFISALDVLRRESESED
jgi:hypothetical protein